jgi:hypothetical protein
MLTVGQTLIFVPSERRRGIDPVEVTVEKVGRKWAAISNRRRIGIGDLAADGGQYSSPGRCYLSREEYDGKVRAESAWRALSRAIDQRWNPPEGVSVAKIEAAAKMLGLTLDAEGVRILL